ncbi:peroxin [Thoreauomyces humboldtii]|nr:peroxin [Thoreauomyces humboldtii]
MSGVGTALQGFASRNRRKFYWLGGTVGSGYMLLKYAQWKWAEYQQKRDLEQTAKSNVKRRFEQNLQDCTFAVGSLLPTLGENLFEKLNVELITAKLQQSRQAKSVLEPGEDSAAETAEAVERQKRQKIELWQELKILSFTRTIASVYLVTLLIVFTHLQLNLLGRFFYLDSVMAFSQVDREQVIKGSVGSTTGSGGRKGVSDRTERKYLTFSWYVLNVGWRQCVERVQTAVEKVVGSMSLKESITYDSMIEIIGKVRQQVEHDADGNFSESISSFLLPKEGSEEEVLRAGGADEDGFNMDADLTDLLNETRDFLDSPDFRRVVTSCFDEAFDLLFKQIRPTFHVEQSYEIPKSAVVEVAEGDAPVAQETTSAPRGKVLPLAGVVPVVSRLVHHIVNGVPNIFLEALSAQPDLKAICVVAYTSWEDKVM